MVRTFWFIERGSQPVVVFDTFRDIIEANWINTSLLMLRQLMAGTTETCTFAIPVDTTSLTDIDRGILLHDITIYDRS